jgi:poly(3-hydroxybutyrate) depolymerase
VRAAWTPVVAALLLAGCGGGGGPSYPEKPTVEGPFVRGANGVWIFRPAGPPKRLVIYLHGQGGPTEATPAKADHLAPLRSTPSARAAYWAPTDALLAQLR